jgi:5'(3')-deoxyribonucleotidase
MHLKDVAPLTTYKIYCDLDGVLVDFNNFAEQHIGIRPSDMDGNSKRKKEFWSKVNRWVIDGNRFFGAMSMMEDASELWEYIERYDPIILSATGHVRNAATEKREWVHTHLGNHYADTAILVDKAVDKSNFACSNCVLIDDRSKAIDPWIEAGGIGILHISAQDTIEQLKDLGI